MNALTKMETAGLPALQMAEDELVRVLQSSLYPGAQLESIKLVLGYCKATGLDPMQKPVHIVPMKVSTGQKDSNGWDIKENRDVVMPGIGLYRSQAARTGQYVGMSEPAFGPTKTLAFTSFRYEGSGRDRQKVSYQESMEYPEWCTVIVRRLIGGTVCEFPAREYWLENYATKGSDSTEPNAMWRKRPFGQIAKCAEAQALRKAFPGETGSQPTAEEMEGKTTFDDGRTVEGAARVVDGDGGAPDPTKTDPKPYPQDQFDKNLQTWVKYVQAGKKKVEDIAAMVQSKGAGALTEAQMAALKAACEKPAVTYAQVADKLHKAADMQALDDAATLIGEVADPEQRKDLSGIYDQRAEALNKD